LNQPETSPFTIDVRNQAEDTPGVTTVLVTGEVDIATAPKLESVLRDAQLCPGPVVVADLREATFMDSIGLGSLVSTHRTYLRDGRSLEVWCVEGPIARLVTMTQLDRVITVSIRPHP
jgi:anti-sigma B factor antagonist